MSDNLPALSGGGRFLSRRDRQLVRAMERIDAGQIVAVHRDRAQLERVATTAERGMTCSAQLGALEVTLVAAVPNAAGYVHASAVAGAIGIAGVVHDAARGL